MYVIYDTWGIPQCGCEVLEFDEYYEAEIYIDNHPDLQIRMIEGYATFVEEDR